MAELDMHLHEPLGVYRWDATLGKKGVYLQLWFNPPEGTPDNLNYIDGVVSLFGDSRVMLGDIKKLLAALRQVPEAERTAAQKAALKDFEGLFLDLEHAPSSGEERTG